MDITRFSLFSFRILDIVDILLVACVIYYLYSLLRGSIAVNISIGLIITYMTYLVVTKLHMQVLGELLGGFVRIGFLALIIVFQPELRRFLLLVGKKASVQRNKAWWRNLFGGKNIEKENTARIKPILDACKTLQKSRTGALIVFARYFDPQFFQNSGEPLNAQISARLLEAIFQKHSPLHDGAVVISEDLIQCASCILPLSDSSELPMHFGLRHRAAIGISETGDAVALIISEETGQLAYAKHGRVRMNISYQDLQKALNRDWQ